MKKINVTSPLMPSFESYSEKLKEIWDSQWLTNNGKMYTQLKEKLMQRLDCQVELFVNGHMALDVAVKALNLHGEVITTPFTFASTTHKAQNGMIAHWSNYIVFKDCFCANFMFFVYVCGRLSID